MKATPEHLVKDHCCFSIAFSFKNLIEKQNSPQMWSSAGFCIFSIKGLKQSLYINVLSLGNANGLIGAWQPTVTNRQIIIHENLLKYYCYLFTVFSFKQLRGHRLGYVFLQERVWSSLRWQLVINENIWTYHFLFYSIFFQKLNRTATFNSDVLIGWVSHFFNTEFETVSVYQCAFTVQCQWFSRSLSNETHKLNESDTWKSIKRSLFFFYCVFF